MKKLLFSFAALCCAILPSKAQENLEFSYTADADIVSCYIWRGLYNGGLSFQPEALVGWTSEHTSFNVGAWFNVGASDWCFRSGLPVTEDGNPNTQLTKEVDVMANLNLWGVTMGFAHYYYFDGTDYFNFGDIDKITGSAQTEVFLGYDFSTLFPNVNLSLTWSTMVSGADLVVDGKRAYSSYLEACYTHNFKYDISLTGVVGISPWMSIYTDGDEENAKDFAVNNLTLRLDKEWTLADGVVTLDLFLQGTMNTCNLNKDNALIWKSGDDKLFKQKLMGAIGLNIAF